MNAKTESYEITRGPGRDIIYELMKYSYDDDVRISIKLQL